MIYTRLVLASAIIATSYASYQHTDNTFQDQFIKIGKRLSRRHAAAFTDLFRGEFFQALDKRKGKGRNRTKRAVWGLDKFFIDAQKTREHFGGLTDRIGDVFEDEEVQVLKLFS